MIEHFLVWMIGPHWATIAPISVILMGLLGVAFYAVHRGCNLLEHELVENLLSQEVKQ
jgi:hypothetical protein